MSILPQAREEFMSNNDIRCSRCNTHHHPVDVCLADMKPCECKKCRKPENKWKVEALPFGMKLSRKPEARKDAAQIANEVTAVIAVELGFDGLPKLLHMNEAKYLIAEAIRAERQKGK